MCNAVNMHKQAHVDKHAQHKQTAWYNSRAKDDLHG